jgi:hypothetical protein
LLFFRTRRETDRGRRRRKKERMDRWIGARGQKSSSHKRNEYKTEAEKQISWASVDGWWGCRDATSNSLVNLINPYFITQLRRLI